MSTASFDPLHFLAHISPDLLRQYANYHRIAFETDQDEAGEKVAEECIAMVEKQPEAKQGQFLTDMSDIDEIATGNGCDLLLHKAIEQGGNWEQKEYQALLNAKERAMYFYLHCYDLFYETFDQYNLENLQGWRGEKVTTKNPKDLIARLGAFKQGLKTLYAKEYKGKNLKVKHLQRDNAVVFVAYIEDAFVNDLSFEKGDLRPKTPRKPVLRAYFRYRHEEGVLEVKAPGGMERIAELQRQFIEHLLQETPVVTDQARYDFERVRDIGTLAFPTETRDGVERVTLKGLRLFHNSSKAGITIYLGNVTGHGTAPMIECLEKMHLNLAYYLVTQFKIEVVFKNESGEGRRKKVTVTVTKPNVCDLRDRDIDATVRRLLKRWKLDLF